MRALKVKYEKCQVFVPSFIWMGLQNSCKQLQLVGNHIHFNILTHLSPQIPNKMRDLSSNQLSLVIMEVK